jgi:hypothetical protein
MKLLRSFLAANLIFSLVFISFLTLAIPGVSAQDSKIALQRGYRTGYSDGYMAGYRDAIENAAKSYARHSEYKSADRAYNKDYGQLVDYQDGYQQGFEIGYDTGYGKESFDATIPTDLSKRGIVDVKNTVEPARKTTETKPAGNNVGATKAPVKQPAVNAEPPVTNDPDIPTPDETVDETIADTNTEPADYSENEIIDDTNRTVSNTAGTGTNSAPALTTKNEPVRSLASGDEIIIIPADTELIIELIDEIDTKRVREGDSFKAKITAPYEISGAIIEGRIAKNRPPGKIKRRAELILSFDRIILSEGRWSNFNAIITEVLPVKGDNVKRVDNEGEVEGQRPYKEDGVKIGAATGTGLIIGAVVGGPVGAAVGAGVGAAFGVGAAVVERGDYIKLYENQQLRIKTAYETQIR